jgi:ADP-ribose pyrophosphatase
MVLIEQYRYALRKKILEFPAGTRDDDEDFLVTAQRELKEEIGGSSSKWTRLPGAYSTPGFTDELLHTFLAEDVQLGASNLEHGELVESVTMTPAEVEQAISSGHLSDMKSIVAFYLVKLHLSRAV